ncbi:uncharacterized protein, partial [Drosophila tropicalis]|uniref:uncharacterized protein n=1 Tax=Drosophila tropicalis TaxID=46794 RepID=UPI0035ABA2B0
APHFGGLWEASVKSAKTLALKNISNASLTFEELLTVFSDVEAILNSRPIAPTSDDPNDFNALTPGHLLIGTELTSVPESLLYHSTDPPGKELRYLDRWQRETYLKQQFWTLWARDYVHNLQQRSKWIYEKANVALGQLVIVHEDNVTAQHWPLARVVSVNAGPDDKIRVVELKTAKGIFKRPIHKIAPLPESFI